MEGDKGPAGADQARACGERACHTADLEWDNLQHI